MMLQKKKVQNKPFTWTQLGGVREGSRRRGQLCCVLSDGRREGWCSKREPPIQRDKCIRDMMPQEEWGSHVTLKCFLSFPVHRAQSLPSGLSDRACVREQASQPPTGLSVLPSSPGPYAKKGSSQNAYWGSIHKNIYILNKSLRKLMEGGTIF